MSKYSVEIEEADGGLFVGSVVHEDDAQVRTVIGTTSEHGMKPNVEEEAKKIAKRHRDGPEVVPLDI